MDNLPYYGKRDIFYYLTISDKSEIRDSKISELFGEPVNRLYYTPSGNTDKIYCAKFWKDSASVNNASFRIKYSNINKMYREEWINCIPDNIDINNHFYETNLKRKKEEYKFNEEWKIFRSKYKAIPAYKRVVDPQWWIPCKNCGLIPLIWEYDNGRRAACGCGVDEYNHPSISAESIMSHLSRNNGSAEFYNTSELRMNWNQWVNTGQDIFKDQKKINPNIW